MSNDNLFEPDIEGVIDRIFSGAPEIRYFQIGNEVTTILPSTGPTITIEQYAALFQRIYEHVQSHYPGRAILLTQSALGSGLRGRRSSRRSPASPSCTWTRTRSSSRSMPTTRTR